MKQKKQIKFILLTSALILSAAGFFFIKQQGFSLKNTKETLLEANTPQNSFKNFDTSLFIQKAYQLPEETVITPKTMAEVEEVYKNITMIEIPHIFINQLPADWKIEKTADKTLFMKIVTALILRSNERIINERTALHLLQEKRLKNIPWNEEEKDFFQYLVQKYDAGLKRKESAQFAELIDKVNIIPPSLAVAQAMFFTDWGKKNPKSIYGEYGWKGEESYEPIEFNSLTSATDSFALQLNARSQLLPFRELRRYFIPMERERYIGVELIHTIDKFMEWDKDYTEKLIQIYRQGKIKELDWACFKGLCKMPQDDPTLELE